MTFADTALAVIEMARRGEFTGISDRFLPQLRPLAPPEALRAAWDAEVAKNGQVSALGTPLTEAAGPGTVLVKVPVTFERATATVAVGLAGEEGEAGEEAGGDEGPWITGIQLLPASAAAPTVPWVPPPYADPDRFTEHDVTVGDGPLAGPGTLSVPHHAGSAPVPGVVLLSGSGAHDQDETIGRNKPLKDLAWGLASADVAVLRFEKVTHAHPDLVSGDETFTDRKSVV